MTQRQRGHNPKDAGVDLGQFKSGQRQIWEGGDYRPVGRLLEPAAHLLVEHAGVVAGQRVLDVGTASGAVAIAAAQAGGKVVGIDITDAWFDEARRRAAKAGVDIELETGDAEDLPVDDKTFDVVLSGFGAIFAPRHEVVAAELTRVCRPGGTIAFTAWTPGGKNDRIFSVLARFLPSPPEFVTPHILWGDPAHVRALFAPHQVDFEFHRPTFTVEFPTAEAFESFALENSGGVIAARRALEALGRWRDAHAALHEAIESLNEADDARYRVTWEFLLAVGTRSQ